MPWNLFRTFTVAILAFGIIRPTTGEEVNLEAEHLTIEEDQVVAEGKVKARQGQRRAKAAQAKYDRSSHWLELFGEVSLSEPGFCIQAPRARLNTQTKLGEALSPKLHVQANDSWVLADKLERYAPQRSRLDNAAYTACTPPEDPPWRIRSSSTYINQETDYARHWNARFEVSGIPVLYTPYLGHYTDNKRHTGFLLPSFEFSGTRGTDITVPFYWNIAPQLDATIELRHMTRNGTMPQLEVRHLAPKLRTRLYGEFLPNDNTTGEDRFLAKAEQAGKLPGEIDYRLNVQRVSDAEYLSFFGSGVEQGSQRFLASTLDLSRGLGPFRWQTRFAHYQDLQDFNADDTVQELPRMRLQGEQRLAGLFQLNWDSEYVYFFREEGKRTHRLFANPALKLPLNSPYGSLVPSTGIHWTGYRIQPQRGATSSKIENRLLPHFSLRATSQLQRTFGFKEFALRHVIEPELFYLYVPFRDQSDLPVLDTRERPLRFHDLFDINPRFSGLDRMGDANQLTTAISSRIEVKSEDERWEAAALRLGQIRFFRDREVTLPGDSANTRGFSNLFGELTLSPIPEITWKTMAEYDPERPSLGVNQMDYFESELGIILGEHRLQARYLLRNDSGNPGKGLLGEDKQPITTEELESSAHLALSKRWSLSGTFRHSFRFDETLLQRVGVNYDACCWGIGLSVENRILRQRRAGNREETLLWLTFSFRTLGGTRAGINTANLF